MPRHKPKARSLRGPFFITDANDQPLLDASGNVRVFSTIARANPHLRPGDKVVPDKR